jgi:hypothetical protein
VPRWKKDAKEFTVNVRYSRQTGIQTYLPKPIAEWLGNPPSITFVIRGRRLEVRAGGQAA